jgi:hypothetical protein
MNVLCGMTGFAVSEPFLSDSINSDGFAKAIIKILLTHGLCHTIVVDKDSKFRGTFEDAAALLGLNIYTVSGGNHDAIMTERFHVYLNKCLTLFFTERDYMRTATEGIQLCCPSAMLLWLEQRPRLGTNLSCSLVVTVRDFHILIEYTKSRHSDFNPSPSKV